MTNSEAEVTIAEIALELGISVATVSKVLNGRPDVAPATRARVEAGLELHNYQRRPRRTRRPRSRIMLVFHQYGSPWSIELIQGVGEICAEAGADLVLSQLDGARRPSAGWLEEIVADPPLGLVFVMSSLSPAQQRMLARRNIATVLLDTDGIAPAHLPTIGSNNWNGGYLATTHLLELGHRRIGMISGPAEVMCGRARIAGYRSAHDALQLGVDPDLVRYGDFYINGGYRHAHELLTGANPPTAIFAGSDLQAMGVLRAARALGLRVPQDLSVVGYDDLPVSSWLVPALTTVRQPLREMARTGTRMLLDLAAGSQPTSMRIDLTTDLVLRESTAAPAPAH